MHGSLAHSDNNCESAYRHVHTKKKNNKKKNQKKQNMSVKLSGEEVSSSSVSKIIKLGDTSEILDDVDVAEWKIKDDGSI